MSTETLVLRQDKTDEKPRGTRERRISQKEWPTILERHANGESINAIARDYGVTGPAIRYIVNKARKTSEEQATPPAGGQSAAESPAIGTTTGDGEDAPASAAAPVQAAEKESAPAFSPAGGEYTKEAVKRLAAAAAACCATVENAGHSARELAEIKARLHEVRRALAAIEIDVWKHESRR